MEPHQLHSTKMQSDTEVAIGRREPALHKKALPPKFKFEGVMEPRDIRIANLRFRPEEREKFMVGWKSGGHIG